MRREASLRSRGSVYGDDVNLFVTDKNPIRSAMALDHKRVGKMLMECNQMMSLAIKLNTPENDWNHCVGPGMLTNGFAHKNHPVSIWVRASQQNFFWTLEHARALGSEFSHRFNKEHGSSERTNFFWMQLETTISCLPDVGMLPFQNSARHNGLRLDFTHEDPPFSYRQYLNTRWDGDIRPPKWTNREPPLWRASSL